MGANSRSGAYSNKYGSQAADKVPKDVSLVCNCFLLHTQWIVIRENKTITTNQQLNSVFSEYDFFLRLLVIFIQKKRLAVNVFSCSAAVDSVNLFSAFSTQQTCMDNLIDLEVRWLGAKYKTLKTS